MEATDLHPQDFWGGGGGAELKMTAYHGDSDGAAVLVGHKKSKNGVTGSRE